jgi:hypothetical protein
MMDQKACQILFDTYWSSTGWKPTPTISPADLEYARHAGYMFDPIVRSHDDIVQWLITSARQVDHQQVADAFLASLSTRRLDLRSALGSYAVARHFPEHSFQATGACPVCGLYAAPRQIDLNVLSFERHKWGGVRHLHPDYVAFDLEHFATVDKPPPIAQDLGIMQRIVEVVQQLPARAKPRDLEKQLAPVLASNKAEREVLIQILSYCGILQPAGYSGFFDAFTRYDQRTMPPVSKTDWEYPIWYWHGVDGVNAQVLHYFFPGMP